MPPPPPVFVRGAYNTKSNFRRDCCEIKKTTHKFNFISVLSYKKRAPFRMVASRHTKPAALHICSTLNTNIPVDDINSRKHAVFTSKHNISATNPEQQFHFENILMKCGVAAADTILLQPALSSLLLSR